MNLDGCQLVKQHMDASNSSASWKSGDGVSDQFPAGLRVLLVDDDPTCLVILEKMLKNCLYEVTKCNRAEIALSLLQKNRTGYDIVISDVHMPDMDGFKLLEAVGLEMDLPVIMMSADDSKSVVMKGVTHGACDYLIKPVRMEALKNIWQHVVRKRRYEWKDFEQVGSAEEGDRQQKPTEDVEYSSSANEGNWKNSKRKKEEEEEAEERDDSSTLKKPRVVWSVELHQQFVGAVNQLGIEKAVPKKILELMNVPGLTRENVASHLQKYRLYLRRLSGVSQHQSGLNSTFMNPQEGTFTSLSSLNAIDLQALAATGQLPAQSLSTFQAAALGRSASKCPMPIPLVDQTNLFSFETPKMRFGEGQQQLNNSSKQMNLLHGIPTNMEPKHLSSFHQSAQSYGGMNMLGNSLGKQSRPLQLPITQSQSRAQLMNETNNGNLPRLSSSMGQPIVSDGIGNVASARNGMAAHVSGMLYNQISHSSPMVDFSVNHGKDLQNNNFSIGSNSGMSTLPSKPVLQDEVSSKIEVSRGPVPSYDIFGHLQQRGSLDWNLHNIGQPFDASQHSHTNMQGHQNALQTVHHGIASNQSCMQNRDAFTGTEVFPDGETSAQVHTSNFSQQLNTLNSSNALRIKSESLPDANSQKAFFPQQYGQDDLMSALLKQQEGIIPTESDFGFDEFPLDNLPA